MSTTAKIQANRRNAQHSTGPNSPEGKAASSKNATCHGLTAAFTVLPHEDQAAFNLLLETYTRDFTPASEHESFLVAQMAQSRWRLDRTRRFEALAFEQILENAIDETNPDARIVAKLAEKSPGVLTLLHRYAASAEKSYYRAHRELTQARARESRNQASEAQLWLKQQCQHPVTLDPWILSGDLPNQPTANVIPNPRR